MPKTTTSGGSSLQAKERRSKRYEPDHAIALLNKVDDAVASGTPVENACHDAGIVVQTYYRWNKQYGGIRKDQAKRLKALELENARLRRIVSQLTLEKLILKDIIAKRL